MRSHHFRIPVYDMPIRLRPVRHSPFPMFSLTLNRHWPVVHCVHIHRHAGLGFLGVRKFLPLPTAEQTIPTFHLSWFRNRRILLHL